MTLIYSADVAWLVNDDGRQAGRVAIGFPSQLARRNMVDCRWQVLRTRQGCTLYRMAHEILKC
jgi:hypothetical protein